VTDRHGVDEPVVPDPGPVRLVSGLPTGDLLDTATVTVDLPTPRVALAVGAHPDDIEFGAGATLARWAAAGCRVHHLVLTDGSKGSWDPEADLGRLVASRKQECRAAASVLDGGRPGTGERVRFLDAVDGELVNDVDTRREVARVIREVRPDVLLGHDPWRRYRLHPDHREAGFLTLDALVAARDPHYVPELGIEPHRPAALLLWEADLPNHVEPSGRFEAVKVDALLCHHSQFESTMGLTGDRGAAASGKKVFASRVAWQLAQHGAVAGIDAGEAFHLIDQV
jgi:LmbE family N-acetylglucosaminyl deacetylase